MYLRPRPKPGPRTSDLASWPAPVGGLVANKGLATPRGVPAAMVLENFFPTATGATIRRGSGLYTTVGGGSANVEEMWTYLSGNQEEFFAATATTIYNITNPIALTAVVTGLTSGDWVVTQFATTGGTFLVGVNGSDAMRVYDGQFWYPLRASNSYTLAYDGGTGAFTVGQIVTGTTSTSKGTITAKTGTTAVGTLTISNVTGTFQDNEPLTDPTGGAAVANGTRKLYSNLHTLPYDTGTVPFVIGVTITGGTSGATAIVRNISGTTAAGTLIVDSLVGTFQDNEALTGGGSALVNGTSTLRLAGITGLPTGVNTNIWSYVWVYKNRLYFIEKNTLNAWYLAVDSIGGQATVLPMGGVFALGGSLLFGSSWSIESADGLDSRCIFVTGNESNSIGNEGEIAVYVGIDPSDPDQWGQVGVYRSGMPMGKKAHIRAGGDVIIATDLGLVPLSVAVQRDVAALAPSSLSYAIEDLWKREVGLRSASEWRCKTWPTGSMTVVMLPTIEATKTKWLVANLRTGAWTVFTGLNARCLAVFGDRLFFGSTAGKVVEVGITGADQGLPYTATIVPLFEDAGAPGSEKIAQMASAVLRSPVRVNASIKTFFDYDIRPLNLWAVPAAPAVAGGAIWGGGALWGTVGNGGTGDVWGGGDEPPLYTVQDWVSVDGGPGRSLSPALRLTSGAVQPLDTELVRIDLTYTVAEIVT